MNLIEELKEAEHWKTMFLHCHYPAKQRDMKTPKQQEDYAKMFLTALIGIIVILILVLIHNNI